MSLRVKGLIIAGLAATCLFLNSGGLFAAWWEGKDLPVPPGASEAKRETRRLVGLEYEFIYYESAQKMDMVKEFYRQKLGQSGWKERNLSIDISKLPKIEGLPALDMDSFSKAAESNLLFENENETLSITFMPDEFSGNGKTKFTLCRGKKPQSAADFDMSKMGIPELVAKPKKDVYPVYPQSSLISLNEKDRSLRATHYTKDDIEQVISFYKSEMSRYGWYLQDEKPVSLMNKGANANYGGSEACPSCEKGSLGGGFSAQTWSGQLDFTNKSGDSCKIMVAQILPGDAKNQMFDMTTIMVNYEDNSR